MYKECRKDARIVNAAKDAYNALDSLNLHPRSIECMECGYPYCDARYGSVEEFIEAQKERK